MKGSLGYQKDWLKINRGDWERKEGAAGGEKASCHSSVKELKPQSEVGTVGIRRDLSKFGRSNRIQLWRCITRELMDTSGYAAMATHGE